MFSTKDFWTNNSKNFEYFVLQIFFHIPFRFSEAEVHGSADDFDAAGRPVREPEPDQLHDEAAHGTGEGISHEPLPQPGPPPRDR